MEKHKEGETMWTLSEISTSIGAIAKYSLLNDKGIYDSKIN